MMRVHGPIFALLALGTALLGAAVATNSYGGEDSPVVLHPHSVLTELDAFDGTRFIQADAKGNVFVLDGEELVVYSLTKGRLEQSEILESAVFEDEPFIRSASMSRGGDRWLLLDKNKPRLFEDEREVTLPSLLWFAAGVGFSGDTPLVAVEPIMLQNTAMPVDTSKPPNPPLVSELRGHDWVSYSDRTNWQTVRQDDPMNQLMTDSDLLFAECHDRKVWIASRFGYRFRHFSSSGRPLFEMTLPVQAAPSDLPADGPEGMVALRAQPYTRAAVCSSDGVLYSLVSTIATGTEYAGLDRYDPATGKVDRILVDLQCNHRLSAAAGHDGIYLVSFAAEGGGAWLIPWDSLRDQKWTEVKNIRSGTRLTD